MIPKIKMVLAALLLIVTLLSFFGCAGPSYRGGDDLGELRGGSGRPPQGRGGWAHPAPGA